jgi:hypothetical protein
VDPWLYCSSLLFWTGMRCSGVPGTLPNRLVGAYKQMKRQPPVQRVSGSTRCISNSLRLACVHNGRVRSSSTARPAGSLPSSTPTLIPPTLLFTHMPQTRVHRPLVPTAPLKALLWPLPGPRLWPLLAPPPRQRRVLTTPLKTLKMLWPLPGLHLGPVLGSPPRQHQLPTAPPKAPLWLTPRPLLGHPLYPCPLCPLRLHRDAPGAMKPAPPWPLQWAVGL